MSLTLLAGLVVIVAAVAVVLGDGGMIRFGSRENSDFQAKLRPVDDNAVTVNARGKAEREGRSDGFSEFEAHVTGLELPDGAEVEFVVADVVLGTTALEGGRTRLEFDSRLGQTVPPVEAGMMLEVRHKGKVLLAGQFQRD